MRTTYQDNLLFKIIIRITDADGEPFDPDDGPYVDIFAPGADTTDDAEATVLNASQTSLGDAPQIGTENIEKEDTGLYSYIFPIAVDAITGDWIDRWTFTQDGVETEVDFQFEVLEKDYIDSVTLTTNTAVRITLDSSILATDDDSLGEDTEIIFYTEITPLYTSTDLVLMEAGGYLRGLAESALLLNIYKASLEADSLTFMRITNSDWYTFARRRLVTALAAKISLTNLVANMVKTKELGDLRVDYDLSHTKKIIELDSIISDYLPAVQSGGQQGIGTSLLPSRTIKGKNDADFPNFGRGWKESSSERAGANTYVLPSENSSRQVSTFRSRTSRS